MFIELETVKKATLLLRYLEENTNYIWVSGRKPTEWWENSSSRVKKELVKREVLGLDVYEENTLYLYNKYEASHDYLLSKEPRTTATEYLNTVKIKKFQKS